MTNFNNNEYVYILGDCLHDIFYVDTSYRGKIAQMRLLSEIIVRKLIDYDPNQQLTLGDRNVLTIVDSKKYGTHYKNSILAIKNDTSDYYAANSCSHSKVREEITSDDYNKIYDHLLDLLSCLFIQFFSEHRFGTNDRIVKCFSLLPPIIRYKVLIFLYSTDNRNIILIDKLVLVTMKEFGSPAAKHWVDENRTQLSSISSDYYGNMYQYSLQTVSKNIKATYSTMEEAKAFFNYNKQEFINDTDIDMKNFLQLMEFFYMGRIEDYSIKPDKYVINFHKEQE